MKLVAVSVALAAALTQAASDRPPTRNVGTMSDLMVKIIYPASDALFYIESRTPKTEAEWTVARRPGADGGRIRQPVDDAGPRA